jgi:hypothetical protein
MSGEFIKDRPLIAPVVHLASGPGKDRTTVSGTLRTSLVYSEEVLPAHHNGNTSTDAY